MQTKRYVITGGPGIGKSTVINLLGDRGHRVTFEIAAALILEELEKGGNILPDKNLALFQEEVLRRQLALEGEYEGEVTFHDRSIVDGHAYSKLGGIETPRQIIELGRGRYHKVFILDRLPYYENNEYRFETPEEAKRKHSAIIEAYIEFGYEPVMVPVLSPKARVEFILSHLE